MSITAKPFKFLNQQTNVPTAEFQKVKSESILNQVYSEGSSLLNGITSAISSDISTVTSIAGGVVNDISSGISDAESAVGGAVSAVTGVIGSVANTVSSVVGNAVSGIENSVTGVVGDITNTTASSTAISNTASSLSNPLNAVGNLIPTNLTTGLSNALNVGSIFNTGTNLAGNSIGGAALSPITDLASQGNNLISNLGRNISNGVNSLSSSCANQLLNDLNQYCNMNTQNYNLGLNTGIGACNPQAVAGILGDMTGGNLSAPNLCNSYRQLVGFTMLGAQNGITGVFGGLSGNINNQTVTNKAAVTLFNYGVNNSNLNLLTDLGNSSGLSAITSSVPNYTSLLCQSVIANPSSIATDLSSNSGAFINALNTYNPSALSSNGITDISNIMQNTPPSSSIINSTMSSIFGPSNTVNHVSPTNMSLPNSSNTLNSNNLFTTEQVAANSVLGGSSSSLPSSSSSSSTTDVGINNSNYINEINAANSVLGGTSPSSTTTPDGYTTIQPNPSTGASSSTSTTSSSSSNSLSANQSAANSVLGGGSSNSGGTLQVSNTVSNNPYSNNMEAMSSVLGSGNNGGSTNNPNINNASSISSGSSNSYSNNLQAASNVLGSNTSISTSVTTQNAVSNSSFTNNQLAVNSVLSSSSSSSTNSSSSLMGNINNVVVTNYKYQTYNSSVNVSDVVSNPTQASSGTNYGNSDNAYMAMSAVNALL